MSSVILPHPGFYQHRRTLSVTDVPDCIWPTDNDFDIPVLKLSHQADALDLPFCLWGTRRRSDQMFGTWGFYVDDYRFNGLWKEPMKIINSGCVGVIEPNFTIHDQMPRTVALWHIYRKRWLSRYWQEHGNLRIWVDLNVSEHFYEDNLLGVPQGWRAYATRGYRDSIDLYDRQHDLACERAGTSDILFYIYGGGRAVKELCQKKGYLWLPEQQDKAKGNKIATEDNIELAMEAARRKAELEGQPLTPIVDAGEREAVEETQGL